MLTRRIALLLLSATVALWTAQALAEQLVTPLHDGSELVLDLPASWKATPQAVGPAVNLELSPQSSGDFLVLLTVLPVPAGSPAATPDGVRSIVLERGKQALATALQERLELYEIKGDQAFGYLYHLTDRNPETGPGDYREANQGAILLGQYLISVTVLTHTGDLATVEEAKRLLATARISASVPKAGAPAGRDQPVADGAYRLAMPDEDWALELDLSSFDVEGEQLRGDGLAKMMRAQDPKSGVIVSVVLEKEPQLGTAEKCRAFYWAKGEASPIPKSDIRLSARGDLTLVEWTVKEFMGQRINQRNLMAFLAHSGYCVDMHLSKTSFEPEDQSLFDEFLAKARIVGGNPVDGTASAATN